MMKLSYIDGNPVPLWFIRNYLSHGHDLAVDMHDKARDLVKEGLSPALHSPSMLHFLNNRVSDSILKLNEQSQFLIFGIKELQKQLLAEYVIFLLLFLLFLYNLFG